MVASLIPATLLIATAILLFAVLSLYSALSFNTPEEAEILVVL